MVRTIMTALQEKARELLDTGDVDVVLGWKYEPGVDAVRPTLFKKGDDLGELVFDDRSVHNLTNYLPALAALMAETAETGRAVLGLCLGAQLLARGLGADNRLGAAREFGWCPVERCADAAGDAVMAAAPARFLGADKKRLR